MEPPVVRSRGRPRKRKREENQIKEENIVDDKGEEIKNIPEDVIGNSRKRGRPPKKKLVEIRGQAIVGRYVLKEFEGNGVFLGKIVSYDSGLYRVDYEDGDCEDLDSLELREYLIANERRAFAGDFLERKNKLDEELAKKSSLNPKHNNKPKKNDSVKLVGELEKAREGDVGNIQSDMGNVEVPSLTGLSNGEIDGSEVDVAYDDDDDDDLSSDSCEYGQGWEMRSETETPTFPPPELPPSSGTIGVPEECVSNLFSVYGFLRSFSIRLFLSPFTLDDLVGCLNCTGPNALLDAIHVALLRALKRHLESIASDGDELGSKCLRCIDWGLLDNLTWPVYLAHYLMVMGHLNGDEWKGFYTDVLEKDYCTLSVGTKLMVLQILCDDALDNAEIRAEIDMREESEVGVDFDRIATNPLEDGPRKMSTRHSKIFAGNENINVDAESSIQSSSHSLTIKGNVHCGDVANVDDDGNGDECRLCGMDGVLLCCDGCPSAYHSRCIGIGKQYISDGEWFCPECTINRLGPPINVATLLRGAEVFGVDPYAQMFLGTCNHLLVLKVSVKASTFVRYYNHDDVPQVLSALCSSPHHGASYLGICQAILKFWELPQDILPPLTSKIQSLALENRDNHVLSTQLHPFDKNESQEVVIENCGSSVGESIAETGAGSVTEKLFHRPDFVNVSVCMPTHTETTSMPGVYDTPMNQNFTSVTCKPYEPKISCSPQQGSVDRSSVAVIASYSFGFNGSSSVGHRNGLSLPDNTNVQEKRGGYKFGGRTDQKWKDTCLYMGSFFKPTAYINQYAHGDFAASAAANFAILSSDESRPSEVHASDPRKAMSANVGLQGKAFSAVAVRFFWPSTDKKLIEVPRERCSWCLHCKAPVSSKKACLLNQAALNATRAAMKFVSGLRLAKNLEGALYSIAAYTLYIEESLHGLILGPFKSASYRQEWHKKVEQASSFNDMKSLLLELEANLCTIALSSEWTKMVDNWMDEPSSVPQNACPTPSTQKRGPGRRRKHLAPTEATVEDSNDSSNDSYWWRGGKLAKLVFRRGTLPRSILRKAARQGGSRKIPGISYADGSEVPKRNRQLIWRASVEMARNVSQLALQVRYLDHHIKWSDLARPEQTVQDGKGPETDLYAFRNAHICDKKVVENKIIYGVTFGYQKHLSSRLMKSVIGKEGQDGRDKYWFSEIRVPLYLIKEFEENSNMSHMPSLEKPDPLSKLQKRQLRAARKNIFCYLARKRENLYMCLCASCHRDVLLGVAVKCSACEGYCHKACTTSSTVVTNDDVEFVTTCKQCSPSKSVPQNNSSAESPTSPLAMQGQDYQNPASLTKTVRLRCTTQQYQNSATVAKSVRPKSTNQPSPLLGPLEGISDKKPASSDSNKKPASSDSNSKKSQKKDRQCHWGLIWKKKNTDDGTDFRLKNILLGGNRHGVDTPRPECYLCHNPYNHDLMYIHCETCQHWYHADALQLEESKLSNLIGFKCCRCRRIKSPLCPYSDLSLKKTEVKKIRFKGPKEEGAVPHCVSASISEQTESVPSTPMSAMEEDIYIQVDDPLLLSVSEVEQMPEPKPEVDFEWNNTFSGPAPQKLPVRRHIKNEKDDECFNWSDPSLVQLPPSIETKNVDNPHIEWNVSNDGDLEVGTSFDYDIESLNFENAEFEPQTYFSFTELLEADEGDQLGGVDASLDAWQNLPCETSRSGFTEPSEMGFSNGERPLTGANCSMCTETTPPDLCCNLCGLKVHSHCSPWEAAPQGETWCCGNCIEWR